MGSDDDLLAWIDRDSEDWEIPERLRGPANGIVSNFAIIVLSSRFTSSSINLAIARLIEGQAGFNIWFAGEAKSRLGPMELIQASEVPLKLLRPCWDNWLAYEQAYERESAQFPAREAEALMQALQDAQLGFVAAQHS